MKYVYIPCGMQGQKYEFLFITLHIFEKLSFSVRGFVSKKGSGSGLYIPVTAYLDFHQSISAVAAVEGDDGPRYIIPLILAEAASPSSDFVRICSLIEATNELDSKLEPRTCSKS